MAEKTISCISEARELFLDIKRCLDKGLQVKVAIKSTKPLKSLPQLGYWWAVIIPSFQAKFREDGDKMSRGEVHYWLKMELYYEEIISPLSDTVVKRPKSFAGISEARMSEVIDDAIRLADTIGLDIPEPPQN